MNYALLLCECIGHTLLHSMYACLHQAPHTLIVFITSQIISPSKLFVIQSYFQCSVTCGKGHKTRNVSCLDDASGKVVDGMCTGEKPKSITWCRPGRCPYWSPTSWGEVFNCQGYLSSSLAMSHFHTSGNFGHGSHRLQLLV